MRKFLIIPATALAMSLAGCDIDKTQDGEMPTVDVDVKAGQLPKYEVTKTQDGKLPDVDVDATAGRLPKYDVDVADIDVGTKEVTAKVPDVDVDVDMEEKSFTVPDVDIEMPEDDDDGNS